MRFAFLLIFLFSFLIIVFSIAKETGGDFHIETVRSIYKQDTSLFFFLDRNSSFYYLFNVAAEGPLFFRKIGHFILYGFIAAIIFFLLPVKGLFLRGIVAAGSASFIGIIDEYHQHFLLHRSGRILDIFINTAGSMLAVSIILLFIGLLRLQERLKSHFEQKYNKRKIS